MSTSFGLGTVVDLEFTEAPRASRRIDATAEAPAVSAAEAATGAAVPEPVFSRLYDVRRRLSVERVVEAYVDVGTTSVWSQLRRAVRTAAPLVGADVLALVLAGMLAQVAVMNLYGGGGTVFWGLPAFALLPLVAAYWLSDLYGEVWVHPVVEFRQLTRIASVVLLAAAVGGWSAPPLPVWCAVAWVGTVVFVPLVRTVARHCCVGRAWWGFPTLVIGSGDGARRVADMLLDVPRSGLRPVLLTDPGGDCRSAALPVVNEINTLSSLVRHKGIRHAVVSLPELSSAHLADTLDRYSGLVPHLLVLSDTATLPTLWGASRSCGRLSGLEVRNGLLLATLQFLKRVLDLTVAVAALAATLPLLVLTALMVKLVDGGPVLYGQTRIGLHGRRFRAWKFRTMRPDGDALLADYLRLYPAAREEWERTHKLRKDPRVTRLGRLLRCTSIDELPQIWNVLRGDMSIVGPRPIVEGEIRGYGGVFRLYTTVKPGITGLWQVSGRTNLSFDDRVLLDQFYIRHWSPWLDVYILAKTVVALVKREGAC
jgi:Undecaprenyl-phosphate galactose phosphotransferase WbaP